MDPIVILVIVTVFGCFLLFFLIKKLLKFLVVAMALIITASILGYIFFTGNGELTKDFLPEDKQEQLEQFREQSKEVLKERTGKVKNSTIKKVEQELDKVIQKSKERLGDEIAGRTEQTIDEAIEKNAEAETVEENVETETPTEEQ